VDLVLWAIDNASSGEIFVPKIPSYRIVDVAQAIGPSCEHRIVGLRPGEKIHEEMITAGDSFNTVDLGSCFAILPSSGGHSVKSYCEKHAARPVPLGYSYNSGSNGEFLSVRQIQALIHKHLADELGHKRSGGDS
ncbi:MAG: polysaccharide biosynthesis protein, partial [Methylocella sp.]